MTRIERTVEVNVPVHTAYNQLTQFTDFPRFMEGVEAIRQLDDTHLHWHTRTDGEEHEWDAEITEQVPDRIIAWRNTSGHSNNGRVQFDPVAPDKTRVTMSMECEPEGAPPELAEIENHIGRRAEQDLSRFKTFIESRGQETGEWRGEVHNAQVLMPGSPRDGRNGATAGSATQPSAEQGTKVAGQSAQASGTAEPQKPEMQQQGSQQQESESWLPRLMEVWEEPLVVMRRMSQEMDNLLERFLGRSGSVSQASGGARNWTPPVEVRRRDNRLTIFADLPGIKREDVHVEIKDDKLTIEGDRRAQGGGAEPEYRRSERSYGHFYRMIPLPEGVDSNAAEASMHDGVLEIILPVTPPNRQGRRIDIQPPL